MPLLMELKFNCRIKPQIFQPYGLHLHLLHAFDTEDVEALLQNPRGQIAVSIGIDSLPQKEYFCHMETITLKMERRHVALLKERAKTLGRSRAAVVRDLIDEHLAQKQRPSLYDLTKDLCGSLNGPKDLSTRPLTGYGRD